MGAGRDSGIDGVGARLPKGALGASKDCGPESPSPALSAADIGFDSGVERFATATPLLDGSATPLSSSFTTRPSCDAPAHPMAPPALGVQSKYVIANDLPRRKTPDGIVGRRRKSRPGSS